jgi:outer membrane receptor for ferrienterochelin and colicins
MWRLEFATFYNSIRDAVQLAISTENPGWGKYFNIENMLYKTKGAELELTYRHSPSIAVNAGALTTGRVRLDNKKFVWSTDYVASMTLGTKRPAMQFAVFYKYTDKYLEFAGNYNQQGKLEGIAQQFTSNYQMLDATLGKYFFNDKLYASAGVKNILNVKLVDSFGNLNIHGSIDNAASIGYGRVFFVSIGMNLEQK